MEAKCRFEADDSMGHTLTREHDAVVQVERKFWPHIESPANPPDNSTINRPLENLLVDAVCFQLGWADDVPLLDYIPETLRKGGSRFGFM